MRFLKSLFDFNFFIAEIHSPIFFELHKMQFSLLFRNSLKTGISLVIIGFLVAIYSNILSGDINFEVSKAFFSKFSKVEP